MISAAGLRGRQSSIVASFHRQWHGRNSIEPDLKKTVQVRSHCLKDYFSTKTCLLNSSEKSERKFNKEKFENYCS